MFAYEYVRDLKKKIEKNCKIAQENVAEASERYMEYVNKDRKTRKFEVGDMVLVLLPQGENKLVMSYQGPYTIESVRSGVNYGVRIGRNIRTYHANLLRKYHTRGDQSNHVFQVSNCAFITEDSELECEDKIPEIEFHPIKQCENYKDVVVNPKLGRVNSGEIATLLESFKGVLTDVPGKTDCVEHEIRLQSEIPVKRKSYPIPVHAKDEVIKEIQSMLDMGVVRHSDSPYSSLIVVVKKKDGKLRLCIDFRVVNSVTVFDAEPIPNQEELMMKLVGAKYCTKIDLSKGYWQIPLKEESKQYTAFQSPLGLLELNYLLVFPLLLLLSRE